ncbi:uncharacterized protein LOC129762392 [Toxorhynchites rutilus septentrionalis]|uniref:uncharacterized protein LOC129762392 n=1 Tax=Toxorhynchites rutilus septentrionalis TaxID=329112 RepID=UPI002479588E|nr:uncharacterized protein LOC129762392 [Toxorhynchites rutilus septentrionalis]
MSRAETSRIHKTNENRIQPGRVLIVLNDSSTLDSVVYDIALRCGPIREIRRPGLNSSLIFVQYENEACAPAAIDELRNYPLFRTVEHALISERFCNGSDGNQNDLKSHKSQKNNSGKFNENKEGGRANNTNRHQNNNPKYNNTSNNTSNERNSPGNNVSNSGLFHSADLVQLPSELMPPFPLGCWFCTKMPNFECQCGAYYCDTSCQRSDWTKHRVVCMPRLVPISYSNKRMLQEATASKNTFALNGVSPQQREENKFSSPPNYGQQQQMQPHQQQNQFNQAQNGPRNHTPNKQTNVKNQNQKKKQQQQQQKNSTDTKPNQQSDIQQPSGSDSTPEHASSSSNTNPLNQSNSEVSSQVSQMSSKMALMRLKSRKSVSNGTSQERTLQPGKFPPQGSLVKLTSSLASGVVFIYHNNAQPSDYCELANQIYQAAERASHLKEAPKVDDVIFAPFQGGYYRGKVLAVNGDQLRVQYPDFGNVDSVQWKDAKEIVDERIKWAKYLTHPVRLEGVEALSKEMKLLLDEVEGVDDFELVKASPTSNPNLKEVVLKHPKKSITLNMQLMEVREKELRVKQERAKLEKERKEKEEQQKKEMASKVTADVKYQPVLFDDAKDTKQLPQDTDQQLLIIDASELLHSQIVSVIALADVDAYGAVVEACGTFGPADPHPYKPSKEGEMCLVVFQNDWLRALYDESEPGSYLLLDVGVIAQVPAENVRAFPPGLSRVVYNNEVIVENVSVLEQMMIDGKSESINGKLIKAHVYTTEEGVHVRILA